MKVASARQRCVDTLKGLRHRRRHRALTLRVTQLATALPTVWDKRRRGVVALELRHHVVTHGRTPGRSEQALSEPTAVGWCPADPYAGDVAQ